MSHSVEFSSLPFASHFKLGRIRLNSARTLNALSLDMIKTMQQQLQAWQDDPYIVAVLLEGEGEKAFCAGGNVVDVYRAIAEQGDQGAFSQHYFGHEYQLDQLIQEYRKPIICWGHGYVMGGGMGLFMGARYRLVMPSSRLAMPEIKIGLYPDVGASYFLNQLPEHFARFLALTAYQVNATDACELGLATHYICDEAYQELLDQLAAGTLEDNSHEHVAQHIERVLHGFTLSDDLPLLKPELIAHEKELEKLMSGDIVNIYHSFKHFDNDSPTLMAARHNFLKGSPLSACLILEQLNWGKGQSLAAVFERETILSVNISVHGDFCEGVRALLVDKDQAPIWQHHSVIEAAKQPLATFFNPPSMMAERPSYEAS
ncbi:Carnitinyl-CoA dehydratase [Marinomonas aquimarina]|uniref:3-hydroxyisobutyryl-CoA hydrolase n=1 Tax=Marinomonas aquimarina TaxID=295068 RepID=A0A1A8T9X0_9GAMM|nr:enoyl-CoA hydratase/isomerase family protein [Marinomonas aquimarina]SBS28822.1 Carnitinyl-CoA dehydratase [Marinomonas aquimarina]